MNGEDEVNEMMADVKSHELGNSFQILHKLFLRAVKLHGYVKKDYTEFIAKVYREWLRDMLEIYPYMAEHTQQLTEPNICQHRAASVTCMRRLFKLQEIRYPVDICDKAIKQELSAMKSRFYQLHKSVTLKKNGGKNVTQVDFSSN